MDMLGPTNLGELSTIFGELVRMLKELPPGGFDKSYNQKGPATAATKKISFMCDKQSFKNVVRLAELGASLAGQDLNHVNPVIDPFTDTVVAGFRSLEAKVNQLALDMASLIAKQMLSAKKCADAVASAKPNSLLTPKPKAGA